MSASPQSSPAPEPAAVKRSPHSAITLEAKGSIASALAGVARLRDVCLVVREERLQGHRLLLAAHSEVRQNLNIYTEPRNLHTRALACPLAQPHVC